MRLADASVAIKFSYRFPQHHSHHFPSVHHQLSPMWLTPYNAIPLIPWRRQGSNPFDLMRENLTTDGHGSVAELTYSKILQGAKERKSGLERKTESKGDGNKLEGSMGWSVRRRQERDGEGDGFCLRPIDTSSDLLSQVLYNIRNVTTLV